MHKYPRVVGIRDKLDPYLCFPRKLCCVQHTNGKRGAESCEDELRRAVAHCHSEVDSGLVFSPEHNLLGHIPEEQPVVFFLQ